MHVEGLVALCDGSRYNFVTTQPMLLQEAALNLAVNAGPIFPRLALNFIQEGLRAYLLATQQQTAKSVLVRP